MPRAVAHSTHVASRTIRVSANSYLDYAEPRWTNDRKTKAMVGNPQKQTLPRSTLCYGPTPFCRVHFSSARWYVNDTCFFFYILYPCTWYLWACFRFSSLPLQTRLENGPFVTGWPGQTRKTQTPLRSYYRVVGFILQWTDEILVACHEDGKACGT